MSDEVQVKVRKKRVSKKTATAPVVEAKPVINHGRTNTRKGR